MLVYQIDSDRPRSLQSIKFLIMDVVVVSLNRKSIFVHNYLPTVLMRQIVGVGKRPTTYPKMVTNFPT